MCVCEAVSSCKLLNDLKNTSQLLLLWRQWWTKYKFSCSPELPVVRQPGHPQTFFNGVTFRTFPWTAALFILFFPLICTSQCLTSWSGSDLIITVICQSFVTSSSSWFLSLSSPPSHYAPPSNHPSVRPSVLSRRFLSSLHHYAYCPSIHLPVLHRLLDSVCRGKITSDI